MYLCVFRCWWEMWIFPSFSAKTCLSELLYMRYCIQSVRMLVQACVRLCVHACVRKAHVNLLLPPSYCFLELLREKSPWFSPVPEARAHTQQMFHWKGHECLIICVIDAAFLFVGKCERLLRSYVSIFTCYVSICACEAGTDILLMCYFFSFLFWGWDLFTLYSQ